MWTETRAVSSLLFTVWWPEVPEWDLSNAPMKSSLTLPNSDGVIGRCSWN